MAHLSETAPVARRDVVLVVGLVLVALTLLLLAPVMALSSIQPALAWIATATLVLAVLWMPSRRFRSLAHADRRAAIRSVARAAPAALLLAYLASAVGAAVTILALAPDRGFVTEAWAVPFSPLALSFLIPAMVALLFALRQVTPLAAATWATRKGLVSPPPVWVTHELRRLRVWRTVPAVFGAGIGAGPVAAYARWLEVHGSGRAAEGMVLSDASMAWPFDPLTLALVGYLIGLVIAEATRRHPAPGSPAARLTARTPSSYLTRPARLIPVVFAGWTLIAATIAWAAGQTSSFVSSFVPDESAVWWPAAAAVTLAAVVLAGQRWVVRRPQRLERPEHLHADDVLRSSAAHGLSGAAGALLLITAVGATDAATRAVGIDAFAGAIVGAVSGALLIAGVWALWLGYGSSHRGQIPPTADGPPTAPTSSTRSEEPVA